MVVARGSGGWLWLALWRPPVSQSGRHHEDEATQHAETSPDVQGAVPAPTGGAEEDAFAAFVAAHEAPLFAYLWRATGDEQAAYDLRQETFIRAWRHFAQVRGYERPLSWLYHVATNLALNYRRDLRPTAPLLSAATLASSDPAWRLAERDLAHTTLLQLAPRERLALTLRSAQGLSCDEVAAALGISPAATRVLLFRARERFRALYQAADADHSNPRNLRDQQGGVQ